MLFLIKSRDITLLTKWLYKGLYNQSYSFSSSRVWMWALDHKEGWVPKNWCFQTVMLEKTLESPLNSKEIKPVNSKGNQPWIFIGRTDDEAEAPMLWPPDSKRWLIGKDPDLGKDWEQEEKGVTEDDGGMALLSLSKLREWRTGSLVCCNSWGYKESDTT